MKKAALKTLMQCEPWQRAFTLQSETAQGFHQACVDVLQENCPLRPLAPELLTLQRNLFSTLFIMAAEASGVAVEKLPVYAMVNQCLRAQLTGCDNLLDDEYKSVIPFDLPGSGFRFRSVLTIMSADTVLARQILSEVTAGRLDEASARKLQAALAVLIPSGIEEHEESGLGDAIPTVASILQQVHPRKTGLLFETPIRVAEKMSDVATERANVVAGALADFGIGCQVVDDLQDVADDLFLGKHNLVVYEAFHGEDPHERQLVADLKQYGCTLEEAQRMAALLPLARTRCLGHAQRYFLQAEHVFTRAFPAFGPAKTAALALLVKASIMSERSDIEEGASL